MQRFKANVIKLNTCQPSCGSVDFRIFFYCNEQQEPPHIHVKSIGNEAKFWLSPLRLAFNYGFAGHELSDIERLVREHQAVLLEAWNGHFSSQ